MSRSGRFRGFDRLFRGLGCALAALLLAACASTTFGPSGPIGGAIAPAGPELIGAGNVRIAMLLPKGAGGGATATAFRNAAELAIRDFPDAGIQVAVYDTRGTPAGAGTAVEAALADGARLILGPVFSAEVAAVAPAARQAGIPVVAFSSDASVAGPGVHLLSFLPADDVSRIVSYSASQGRRSFAALLPANGYGAVAEAAFRRAAAAAGGRILALQTYRPDRSDLDAATAAVAAVGAQIDALFVPVGTDASAIAAALARRGLTRDRVKFLGSGQWDDGRVLNDAALVGSWYPAPASQGFEGFARKYRAAYGAAPPRTASLAYDGTVLAAGLVRRNGSDAFTTAALTGPNGFAGIDGVFRLLPSGPSERRLAVYEVTGSGARAVSPAARSFSAGG